MATGESAVVMLGDGSTRQIDLESLVQNATWKDLLIDLVEKNELDPWNIDLGKVVDGYVEAVRKMKVMDLHIPANIILAASVLLRIKSEAIIISSWEEPQPEQDGIQLAARILPEVPPLVSNLRFQPHKKVTLQELMDALDEAVQIKEERETYFSGHNEIVQFVIDGRDIDEKIEKIYDLIKVHADGAGMTTFTELAKPYSGYSEILIELFIPLIYLSHKERINMMQEKFFDEILISLNGALNG